MKVLVAVKRVVDYNVKVRANFRPFLDETNSDFFLVFLGQLHQTTGRAEASRAGAYNHHIKFH